MLSKCYIRIRTANDEDDVDDAVAIIAVKKNQFFFSDGENLYFSLLDNATYISYLTPKCGYLQESTFWEKKNQKYGLRKWSEEVITA